MLSIPTPQPELEGRGLPSLNPGPGTREIVAEQLRLTGLLLRGGGAFFAVLLLLVIVVPVLTLPGTASRIAGHQTTGTNFTFTPEVSSAMAFLALIVPLIVWRDEDPTRRDYHWLMPVTRGTHTLLRVAAGWCWTVVATLMYVIAIGVLPLIVEHLTGQPQPYHPGFSTWEWLVPFAAASVAYAFASVAAVTTQRPLVWIFGSVAIYAGIIIVLLNRGMQRPASVLLHAWNGALGLRPVLYGVIMTTDGQSRPDFWHWAGATAIWEGVAIALVSIAAFLRWRRA
jgi:hypothetical protein